MSFGQNVYGLSDIKVVGKSASAVDLPSAQRLMFREQISSNTLRGDDKIVSVVAVGDAVEFEIEAGGISLAAYAELTGRDVTASGTSPSATKTIKLEGAHHFPYVKIYGKAIGDNTTDDIHVKFYKAKLTSLEGTLQDQEFLVTSASGIAIDDGSKGIMEIVQNETAADLPNT